MSADETALQAEADSAVAEAVANRSIPLAEAAGAMIANTVAVAMAGLPASNENHCRVGCVAAEMVTTFWRKAITADLSPADVDKLSGAALAAFNQRLAGVHFALGGRA